MIIEFYFNSFRNTFSNIQILENETMCRRMPYSTNMLGTTMVVCRVDPNNYIYEDCFISAINLFMKDYYKILIRKNKINRIIK